ncbi:UDP-2,3-diacylglucosamine diphosphatase [Thauera linaloolentis]|uniref:UDP-2,3-diacylglucosamine hydrolase n=1 Tax=Thauera linaloolentis (strain DSM 12138 / JCM 21573 / CCUG 41526 / CIP 105981 / IAM 15112 / NBRC 102519 / 47Lol) TaxID=1123367 RepID=N6Y784_THAL4|nr:UDP-2,3-diacylglucosamine diphosphatase [Thauera linaloolentis]ENO90151.1 UDP-2,3-diacylglucosamine hydrolase [Thauera linaloolentis 47Lol = DSM 12138]MCM8564712.1 UDP-2,3-diacylglucosamine diphosphatase [Thauera linaloolentis]
MSPEASPSPADRCTAPETANARLPALFISDLHLSEDAPDTAAAFIGFMQHRARKAASLFILGDLFEYWAGDDDLDTPFNRRMCDAIRALADNGTAVFFMNGNRDLLAGSGFARASGAALLPDPSIIRFDDAPGSPQVLLSHGDALCTDDTAYQAYRAQVREPAWQRGFLAQPLAARRAFIESLRQKSEAAKREKAMEIMDVNADAVAGLLRASAGAVLVHGHTHRPARHIHVIDGMQRVRWVLADWHGAPRWLAFDGQRFTTDADMPN